MMHHELVSFARAISRVLGWSYVICWSVSFYPQPTLNWRRRSTIGLTVDFPLLNVLGFLAYTLSTGSFIFSSRIKAQYAYRHPHSPESTVQTNDFAFAAHALILCIITYSQFYARIWGFRVGSRQRASGIALAVFWGSIIACAVLGFIIATRGRNGGTDASTWAWLDLVYAFSYVKLLCTVVKYLPQMYSNYQRKSTTGWSINQIQLDFAGAIFSFLQLFIDSALQSDWSGFMGNPAKLGLSIIALAVDCIFMIQHYILYPESSRHGDVDARTPLLRDDELGRPRN